MCGSLRAIRLSKLAQVMMVTGCMPLALSAATIFTDFEGIPDGAPFVAQLSGYTFTNAVVLTARLSLDEVDFPPHSGVNVIGDIGGPISITGYAQSFSGYFTYDAAITVDGYDAGGILRITAMSQFDETFTSSGIGHPNELISIGYPAGLQTIIITGDPGGTSFALDDVTLTTPEPGTGWFAVLGLAAMAALTCCWRRTVRNGAISLLWIGLLISVGALEAAPVIDSVTVSTPQAVYGGNTAVTVTATISDPAVLPNGVLLQQVGANGQIIQLGAMAQSNTDPTMFSLTITVNPTSFNPLQYRVSAGFHGMLLRVVSLAPLVYPVPSLQIQASFINRDNPPPLNNQTYVPLPAGTPVYAGSGASTADSLALTAVLGPAGIGAPVQNVVWSATGTGAAALIPPLPGPNSINWTISPLPPGLLGTVTFTATVLLTTGGQTSASIVVTVGIRSDDVILVGWINPAGVPPLAPAGVDPVVTLAMPAVATVPLGFPTNVACNGVVGELSDGLALTVTTIGGIPVPFALTALDLNYILLWLFTYGSNPNPTTVLSTLGTGRGDFLDPLTNFTSAAQVAAYTGTVTNFKLLNRLQIKFLSNGTGFTAAPTYLQQQVGVGTTINPCGAAVVPPLPVSAFPPIFTPPVTVPALFPGQIGPNNGPPAIRIVTTANPNGIRVSQINDGSPDSGAIRAFDEISSAIAPTPVYWENIGSRITFTAGGPTATLAVQAYPTYDVYTNGLLTARIPQAATPLGNFNAAPYPFGTVPCSIGTIVTLPGSPFFAPILGTIPGGRCGDASSPPDPTVRVPPPAYIVP
jgi:hypothetical protein